jgi:glutathione S-transferase
MSGWRKNYLPSARILSGSVTAEASASPILYSFRRCPYAMRARMAIAVSGVRVALREVVLRDKPAALIAASPKATVPVLVLGGGEVIDESLAIMHWALSQHDPFGWLSGDDQALISKNDGPFKAALDRYKYPHRYGLEDATPHRAEGMRFIVVLDERLSRTPFLTDGAARMADIAIFPFVRQFAATDPTWFADQPVSAVQRWLSALAGTNLFETIMTKYPQWHAGDVATPFP